MITFDNVTKIYDGNNVGIENVSIKIDEGDFVFLVGPSGAGKSTFIKLILKEINADSGSIRVDRQEVTKLSNREIPKLRRKIGIVFQDFRLLPKKTVYENVAFAMEAMHEPRRRIKSRVPQVLEIVGIADQANKYPNELSAGEQQRVAIARAILNDPRILIFDEATSALDYESESIIQNNLKEICKNRTVIIIAHRLSTLKDAQKIMVIDKGNLVEYDTHDNLMALNGLYAYLYNQQQRGEVDG